MLSYQRESVIRCLDERGAILLSPSSSTPMDYQLIKDTPLAHKVVVNVESLLEELHEIANEVSV
jgi:hypothetical protein